MQQSHSTSARGVAQSAVITLLIEASMAQTWLRLPDTLFRARESHSIWLKPPKLSGTSPVSSLFSSASTLSPSFIPIERGMVPVRALECRLRPHNRGYRPKSLGGIVPSRRFCSIPRNIRDPPVRLGMVPDRSLSPSHRNLRRSISPKMEGGTVPDRVFPCRSTKVADDMSAREEGRGPEKEASARNRYESFVRVPSSLGRVPVKPFTPKLRFHKSLRSLSPSRGSVPFSSLNAALNSLNFSSRCHEDGIAPVKPFRCRSRVSRSARPPTPGGIGPVMSLSLRRRARRRPSLVMEGGMVPVRSFLDRSNSSSEASSSPMAGRSAGPVNSLFPSLRRFKGDADRAAIMS
mmetsp:Transcript_35071/g.104656  ORF Transcript_35071/g.104656 Transcript_35071/m.104656 type:complete len:348 (+) Transcript_35071:138-1181(+)